MQVSICALERSNKQFPFRKRHMEIACTELHVGPDTCYLVSKLVKEEETKAWGYRTLQYRGC